MATVAAKTKYLAKALLDHVVNKAGYPVPDALYLALFDVDPGKDGTGGVEVSGGSYARQPILFGEVSAEGVVSNTATVTFPDVTAPWSSVGGFAIMDALIDGNMLYRGDLERPDPANIGHYIPQATTPAVGDIFIIKAGQLMLTEK